MRTPSLRWLGCLDPLSLQKLWLWPWSASFGRLHRAAGSYSASMRHRRVHSAKHSPICAPCAAAVIRGRHTKPRSSSTRSASNGSKRCRPRLRFCSFWASARTCRSQSDIGSKRTPTNLPFPQRFLSRFHPKKVLREKSARALEGSRCAFSDYLVTPLHRSTPDLWSVCNSFRVSAPAISGCLGNRQIRRLDNPHQNLKKFLLPRNCKFSASTPSVRNARPFITPVCLSCCS